MFFICMIILNVFFLIVDVALFLFVIKIETTT